MGFEPDGGSSIMDLPYGHFGDLRLRLVAPISAMTPPRERWPLPPEEDSAAQISRTDFRQDFASKLHQSSRPLTKIKNRWRTLA